MLHWLCIAPSYSLPRASDDNACVASLFRTAKYRPGYPGGGFTDPDQAPRLASNFVHWYNIYHWQSGIGLVAPAQRHAGQDRALLHSRDVLYQAARERHRRRWSGTARDWKPTDLVTLNPERSGNLALCPKKAMA